MPGYKDLAALPTSWALTMWDALPIMLAVEIALAIVILAVLPGRIQPAFWPLATFNVVGGLVYFLVFGSWLAAPLSLLAVPAIWTAISSASLPLPSSPSEGLRAHAWNVLGAVAGSALLAAVIKVLIGPYLQAGSPGWFAIALIGGLTPAGTLGTAAIPALALMSASDSWPAGVIWLAAAAARPTLVRYVVRDRQSAGETSVA